MKLDFSNERVLAVVRIPTMPNFFAPEFWRARRPTARPPRFVFMCNGDKGQPSKPIKNLVAVRQKEMSAAATLLGAKLFVSGFSDATLCDGPGRQVPPIKKMPRNGSRGHPAKFLKYPRAFDSA